MKSSENIAKYWWQKSNDWWMLLMIQNGHKTHAIVAKICFYFSLQKFVGIVELTQQARINIDHVPLLPKHDQIRLATDTNLLGILFLFFWCCANACFWYKMFVLARLRQFVLIIVVFPNSNMVSCSTRSCLLMQSIVLFHIFHRYLAVLTTTIITAIQVMLNRMHPQQHQLQLFTVYQWCAVWTILNI